MYVCWNRTTVFPCVPQNEAKEAGPQGRTGKRMSERERKSCLTGVGVEVTGIDRLDARIVGLLEHPLPRYTQAREEMNEISFGEKAKRRTHAHVRVVETTHAVVGIMLL